MANNHRPLATAVIACPLTKKVREEHGTPGTTGHYITHRTVTVGKRSGRVTLWVDVDKLYNHLAASALMSKGGKAQMGSGIIFAKREDFADTRNDGEG